MCWILLQASKANPFFICWSCIQPCNLLNTFTDMHFCWKRSAVWFFSVSFLFRCVFCSHSWNTIPMVLFSRIYATAIWLSVRVSCFLMTSNLYYLGQRTCHWWTFLLLYGWKLLREYAHLVFLEIILIHVQLYHSPVTEDLLFVPQQAVLDNFTWNLHTAYHIFPLEKCAGYLN